MMSSVMPWLTYGWNGSAFRSSNGKTATVVAAIAADAGLHAMSVHSHGDEQNGLYYADWILVTANQVLLGQPEVVNNAFPTPVQPGVRLWTDNYSSVFPLLKWHTK